MSLFRLTDILALLVSFSLDGSTTVSRQRVILSGLVSAIDGVTLLPITTDSTGSDAPSDDDVFEIIAFCELLVIVVLSSGVCAGLLSFWFSFAFSFRCFRWPGWTFNSSLCRFLDGAATSSNVCLDLNAKECPSRSPRLDLRVVTMLHPLL